ncbi:MAG: zf-TFIIB domain-containing protein [Vicinamibacterales bacterium]|nr:zf-TFIIB domain-containing protein [Vicinamibacterales bacterium]
MSEIPAETLRCPSCGAPAAAASARCGYCRAVLAQVSCPLCFKLLFQGAAFCPHCGTARSRTEVVDGQTTPCPACNGRMRWVKVGATDLLECDTCDGTWLEASAFERLCNDRESQASILSHRPAAVPADSTLPKAREHVHYRPCPRCKKLMNRINFGRLSGAVVDVCKGHGTFLDRGELHGVASFILDGGLDRVRRVEREEMIEEQRRLRELLHALRDA